MEQQWAAEGAGRYERPVLEMHGSIAGVTSAQILGAVFDKTIPAGTPLTGIIGRTSF